MKIKHPIYFLLVLLLASYSCKEKSGITTPEIPDPGVDVISLPVVVHILHNGETIGDGPNLSAERIKRQIEILNEDFRRKPGTRGFNDHPDGGDAKIEFVLAKQTPDGGPTNGINRIDISSIDVPQLGYIPNHYAQYVYWNPSKYINVWTTPLPESLACTILGVSTGPEIDLPGIDLLLLPEPEGAEGILINWPHFGESDIDCDARYGRTLTHEMGHYLGLLHTWGTKDCETNDYIDDTPAVDREVSGSNPFTGCSGDPVMIENYMNFTADEVMNIFTKDQISRMHYVLENHQGRNALINSAMLEAP